MKITLSSTKNEIEILKNSTMKIATISCQIAGVPFSPDLINNAFELYDQDMEQKFACPNFNGLLTVKGDDVIVEMELSEKAFKAYMELVDDVVDEIISPVGMAVIGLIKLVKGSLKSITNKAMKIADMFTIPENEKMYAVKQYTWIIDNVFVHGIAIWENDHYNKPSPCMWWSDEDSDLHDFVAKKINADPPAEEEFTFNSYDEADKRHDELFDMIINTRPSISMTELEEQCDGADKKKPTLDGFIQQHFDDFNKK